VTQTFPYGAVVDTSEVFKVRQTLEEVTGGSWAFGCYEGQPCFWFREKTTAVGIVLMTGGRLILMDERK
jgi:hypothetical protein